MKNNLRLLYIEDDEEILENMTFLLERYVDKVYSARNAEEALVLYFKHKPNILISDIMLSGMNGLEVAKKVREDNKEIPIIIMSAYNYEDKENQLVQELSISSYIQKPLTLQALQGAIKKAIGESTINEYA